MGWIGCVHCEKFQCDFMAQTCALIAPVQPILHRLPCSIETLPNAPKHEFRVQFGGSSVFVAKKIQGDFMAQTCALIVQVQPILHQVSCSNKTLPNAPKYYETHQNMSLGSNEVGRVHSLRKITKRYMAQTCALIAPVQLVLHQVSCSNEILPNTPKHYETHTNMGLGSNGGGLGVFVAKNSKMTSWHKLVH